MPIFASQVTATVPVPFDPPHTITIQKLTGRDVERAQAEHLRGLVAGQSVRGWADSFQRQLMKGLADPAEVQRVIADPLNGFDRSTLVRAGLKGWTYSETVTPEQIADLDDEALEFIAREVLTLTKPALFQMPAEIASDQKKAPGPVPRA